MHGECRSYGRDRPFQRKPQIPIRLQGFQEPRRWVARIAAARAGSPTPIATEPSAAAGLRPIERHLHPLHGCLRQPFSVAQVPPTSRSTTPTAIDTSSDGEAVRAAAADRGHRACASRCSGGPRMSRGCTSKVQGHSRCRGRRRHIPNPLHGIALPIHTGWISRSHARPVHGGCRSSTRCRHRAACAGACGGAPQIAAGISVVALPGLDARYHRFGTSYHRGPRARLVKIARARDLAICGVQGRRQSPSSNTSNDEGSSGIQVGGWIEI